MLWNKNPPLQLIWPKYTNYTDYVDLIQILPKANILKPQHLMSIVYIVHCIYNFGYAICRKLRSCNKEYFSDGYFRDYY